MHFGATVATAAPNLVSIPLALVCLPYLLSNFEANFLSLLIIVTLIMNQSHVLLFGLDKAATFLISSNINQLRTVSRIFYTNIYLSSAISFVVGIAILIIKNTGLIEYNSIEAQLPALISAGIFVHLIWCSQKAYLLAKEKFNLLGYLNFFHLSSAIFIPSLLAYSTSLSSSMSNIVLILVLFRLTIVFFSFVFMPNLIRLNRQDFSKSFFQLLSLGKWMGISHVLSQFFDGLERYILFYFGHSNILPSYHVSLQLTQKLAIFPQALSSVLFAKMPKGTTFDQNLLHIMGVSLTILTVCFMILNENILMLWLGHSFKPEMALISEITFVAMAIASLNFVLIGIGEATGYASIVSKLDLAASAWIIGCSLLLIYHFDIIGASIALLLRETLLLILRLNFVGAYSLFSGKIYPYVALMFLFLSMKFYL